MNSGEGTWTVRGIISDFTEISSPPLFFCTLGAVILPLYFSSPLPSSQVNVYKDIIKLSNATVSGKFRGHLASGS